MRQNGETHRTGAAFCDGAQAREDDGNEASRTAVERSSSQQAPELSSPMVCGTQNDRNVQTAAKQVCRQVLPAANAESRDC